MPSTYPSFRHSVPWLILFLEAVFIVLSYFLDSIVDAHFPYPGKSAHLAMKGWTERVLLFCIAVGWMVLCIC